MLVTDTGKVRSDGDFVFFNAPSAPGTRLRPGTGEQPGVLEVSLAAIPADLGAETVVVAVEFYRRAGSWKIRAVGQGYAGGLADLVTDHGITVTDEPPAAAAPGHTPPPAATDIRTARGEDKLSLEKRAPSTCANAKWTRCHSRRVPAVSVPG